MQGKNFWVGLGTLTLAACSSGDSSPAVDASSDAAAEADAAPESGSGKPGFGDPCPLDQSIACDDGLFCLAGPNGGTLGFCSKTCPPTSSGACDGPPAGTAAYCVVTDANSKGDKGCAFVCTAGSSTFPCPGALKCSSAEDPPGSGQKLCLP